MGRNAAEFSTTSPGATRSYRAAVHHENMHDQRGLSSGVQLTLLFPLAFGVLLLTLQWAMVSWAESSALAAAQDGARVTAALSGSVTAGESVALGAASNGSLEDIRVTVTRGASSTTVTVTGSAPSLLPGYRPQVSRSSEVPTERLTRS